jgi:hypothetical protein
MDQDFKDHRYVLFWWGRAVSARSMPSRAPQSKLLLARVSSYHAPLTEQDRSFGVSIDSKLDERIADLSRLCATLNLSEITNGGSKTSWLYLSRATMLNFVDR